MFLGKDQRTDYFFCWKILGKILCLPFNFQNSIEAVYDYLTKSYVKVTLSTFLGWHLIVFQSLETKHIAMGFSFLK